MFEVFTDSARRALVLAQEEARSLGHETIGTDHLLLGVLHPSVAAPSRIDLESLGVSAQSVLASIEAMVGRRAVTPTGHLEWQPLAKDALELSLGEAIDLGSEEVRPQHLVLGILRVPEGLGAQVIARLGVDPQVIRDAVLSDVGTLER